VTFDEELLDLERSAWKALATEGAAEHFYSDVLADEVLMLLPGGLVIDDRAQVIASMRGTPWSSYSLQDERVLDLGCGAAIVAYKGTAVRDGRAYTALFNSTWVRTDAEWRLAVHQQTPI
jgi:hypothetical protein